MDVSVIGGGMIVHDQILPSFYHLQRVGKIGRIAVVATSTARIRDLIDEPEFARGFPGQSFTAHPDPAEPPEKRFDDRYRRVIPEMRPRQLVVVATPDDLHFEMVRFCLEHDQHVLCVKPLVLRHDHAAELAALAKRLGLLVGVEYHKRFDRRALEARKGYRAGRFGAFRCGDARLIEPFHYRRSNFQNWFTTDRTDPFTYIGCHYVDLLYFISGLRPVEVSVVGVEGAFPNGNRGYMWANARVTFENGGVLSINTGLGYPDHAAGANDQGMTLYCEGVTDAAGGGASGGGAASGGAVIHHDDQYRGVGHGYLDGYREVNPDYFRLVPWEGEGLRPVGYGYDSIAAIAAAAAALERAAEGLTGQAAIAARREALQRIDEHGIIATPANSFINELTIEAARASITNGGRPYRIDYEPAPAVRPA